MKPILVLVGAGLTLLGLTLKNETAESNEKVKKNEKDDLPKSTKKTSVETSVGAVDGAKARKGKGDNVNGEQDQQNISHPDSGGSRYATDL